MKKTKTLIAVTLALATVVGTAYSTTTMAATSSGKWVAGDFHNHTYLTDGSKTEADVMAHAFGQYGLDWMANSEHGGQYTRDTLGNTLPNPLWRWVTLKDYSYPLIQQLRAEYSNKLIVQGLEWNVPTHEHASVGIIADSATPISNFEYMFDAKDKDTSRSLEGLLKSNSTAADAVAGAQWLEDNFKTTSYFLPNHPSRQLKYTISDFRDFNNAAPDVCFGFEGMPGHQKEAARGGYSNQNVTAMTYGGADYMVSQVGGLWDALLGEGRHFWTFVNSDFHNDDGDFWPGEYAKSYTYVKGNTYEDLVAGMRSGKSFAVNGDLINRLDFTAKNRSNTAGMGETLDMKNGDNCLLKIKFKSPEVNNNGDKVKVDHIDLIGGEVKGFAQPGTAEYSKATNETTKVIATFTSKDWVYEDGWYTVNYNFKKLDKNMYFRLRGTNLGINVSNETDAQGNPLCDNLMGTNDASKAYKDLWFYSNPVFVNVK